MIILEPDAEHGVGQKLNDLTTHFKQFFFGQKYASQAERQQKVAVPLLCPARKGKAERKEAPVRCAGDGNKPGFSRSTEPRLPAAPLVVSLALT
ncbi:hypothetical protein ACMGDH_06935 [Sphingomonas sp. DT-207]